MSHWDTKLYGKGVKPRGRASWPLERRAPRRYAVLSFIKARIAAGEPFPSTGDIAKHMGWKTHGSARATLDVLCYVDGVLARDAGGFKVVE